MNTNNNIYKPKQFAEMINVSVGTLQRWDREGILKSFRSPTDRRYYTQQQYLEYTNNNNVAEVVSYSVSKEQRQLLDEFTLENGIKRIWVD